MNTNKIKTITPLFFLYFFSCVLSIIILYKQGLTIKDFNWGMTLTSVVTAISFLLPFIIYFKQKKEQKKQIYFIENEGTFVFNHIAFNLDYINAICDKKKTSKQLILYEGTILNTGYLDIDKESFKKPLSIKLLGGYKWIWFKIKEHSKEVLVDSRIKDGRIEFEWDLLKPKEYIKFEAIIEFEQEYSGKNSVPILRGILRNLSLEGTRGVDLKINKENPVKKESIIERARLFMTMMIFVLIAFGYQLLTDSKISQTIITPYNDTLQIITFIENKKIQITDSIGVKLNIAPEDIVSSKINEVKIVSYKKEQNAKLVFILLMGWSAIQIILLSINMYFFKKRLMINDFTAFPYKGDPYNRTF